MLFKSRIVNKLNFVDHFDEIKNSRKRYFVLKQNSYISKKKFSVKKDKRFLIKNFLFKKIYKVNKDINKELNCIIYCENRNKKVNLISKFKNKIIFHFDPVKTIEYILYEKYSKNRRPLYTYLFFHYHKVPAIIRKHIFAVLSLFSKKENSDFPKRYLDNSVDNFLTLILESLNIKNSFKFSNKKRYAVCLSHDLDEKSCYKNAYKFAKIDEKYGFLGTFNIVGCKENSNLKVVNELNKRGHKISIHGQKHDNKLIFINRKKQKKRLNRACDFLSKFNTIGFRSPSYFKNINLMDNLSKLKIKYDSSFLDTDDYSPNIEKKGCLSHFPYFYKNLIEIPITIPYDSPVLKDIKVDKINEFWQKKVNFIKQNGGLIVVNTHPNSAYCGQDKMIKMYEKFVSQFENDDNCLKTTLEDLSVWIDKNRKKFD